MGVMKKVLAAGLGASVLVVLGACGSSSSGDAGGSSGDASGQSGELITVGMGTQPWIGYGPWEIAKAKGFDKAHGIDLQLSTFTTDADVTAAFASNKIVATNAATITVGRLLDKYPDQVIVLVEDVSTAADAIIAGPAVASVADLAGKKVAYEEGSTSDLLLRYALGTVGLTMEDITAVPTPAANAGAALVSGDVDAAVTYEPYIAGTVATDPGIKTIYTAGEKSGLISDVLTVQGTWAKANPKAVEGLLAAWNDSVEFLRSNPQEGQEIIAKAVGSSAADLGSTFAGVQFFNVAESTEYLLSDFGPTSVEVFAILDAAGDPTAKGVDLMTVVDSSYGKAVSGQ